MWTLILWNSANQIPLKYNFSLINLLYFLIFIFVVNSDPPNTHDNTDILGVITCQS